MTRLFAALLLCVCAGAARAQDQGLPKNDADYKAAAKDLAENAGFVNLLKLPDGPKLQEEVLQILAKAVKAERAKTKGRYYWMSSILIDVGPDASKNREPGYLRGPRVETKSKATVDGDVILSVRTSTVSLDSFFADNEYDLPPDAKKAFDPLAALLKAAPGSKIQSVEIDASANTFPNTGKAQEMTHKELSLARAKSAARLVAQVFNGIPPYDEKDVDAVAKASINADGYNYNGTGGPTSPVACNRPRKELCASSCLPIPKEAADILALNGGNWAKVPAVEQTRLKAKYYDAFKYVKVFVTSIIPTQSKTPKEIDVRTPVQVWVNLMAAEKPVKPGRAPKDDGVPGKQKYTCPKNPN